MKIMIKNKFQYIIALTGLLTLVGGGCYWLRYNFPYPDADDEFIYLRNFHSPIATSIFCIGGLVTIVGFVLIYIRRNTP
jgi:hypothetical protein